MTHNYVDIMSRIYVDNTPEGKGSTSAAEAQSRSGERGAVSKGGGEEGSQRQKMPAGPPAGRRDSS